MVFIGFIVYKIVFKKDVFNGVFIVDGVFFKFKYGSIIVVYVCKEVILVVGVINLLRIFEFFGIGSRFCLEKLGIDVVVDNLYVGENF